MRHWFWHIIAIMTILDWSEGVTDEEWERYLEFMRRHGFDGCP